MIRWAFTLFAWLMISPVVAQTVTAAQAIRSQTVITPNMLSLQTADVVGAYSALAMVVGMEARVNIYPGRPIMIDDVGRPAVLERNQLVVIVFRRGGLTITSEGRVLDRAGIGERVRVMNLDSRSIVFGRVNETGMIEVGL